MPLRPAGAAARSAGQVCATENNLSLATMDFLELADNTDPDGVVRSFRQYVPQARDRAHQQQVSLLNEVGR